MACRTVPHGVPPQRIVIDALRRHAVGRDAGAGRIKPALWAANNL